MRDSAALKLDAVRPVERIRQDAGSAPLGLAEDDRLLDLDGLASISVIPL